MTEREDQGRALLRLLQGVQVSDTPAVERHETVAHPEFASGTLFPSTLHMTDVRGAAAGEQHDNVHRTPPASNMEVYPYHLPRPGASASSPARSAGADLLRMLQGAPQSSATTTSTTRQRHRSLQRHYTHDLPLSSLPPPAAQHHHYHQYQQQHQQHPQHQDLTLPTSSPPNFPRSVAAEQERFLKKFLRIESPDNEARSTPTLSTTPLFPAPSSAPLAISATTAAMPTSMPAVVEIGDQEGQERNKSRTKERGKSRGPRGGWSRGGEGGGGGENNTEISSTPARERSKRSVSLARGHMEASHRGKGGQKGRGPRTQIETNGREAKKGGRGGGGRNGGGGGRSRARSPSPSTAYAWSAFQNSPDPKNIPIPSLSHFSMSSDTSAGDDAPVLESSSCRDEMVIGDGRIQASPPERDAKPTGDTRSSAQRAEADIKKMLGLG